MIVVTKDGIHDDFAQALCVDDDALLKIKENVGLIHDFGFIMSLLDNDGLNAVIVRLELRNKHDILCHVKQLLEKFDSVSWVRNGKLFTRRRS